MPFLYLISQHGWQDESWAKPIVGAMSLCSQCSCELFAYDDCVLLSERMGTFSS